MLYYSYIVFGIGTLIKLIFCLNSWLKSGKFYSAKFWFTLLLLEDIGIWAFLLLAGSDATSYAIFYFWSDLIVLISGLILLVRLAELSFAKARAIAPILRGSAMAIISGLAVISSVEVFKHLQSSPKSFHPFIALAANMEQYAAAAGMLASIILFVTMTLLLVPGVQIRKIVGGMAIFYSCTAVPISAISLFGFSMAYLVPWFSIAAFIFLGMAISKPDTTLPAMRRPFWQRDDKTQSQSRPAHAAAYMGLSPRYVEAAVYGEGR